MVSPGEIGSATAAAQLQRRASVHGPDAAHDAVLNLGCAVTGGYPQHRVEVLPGVSGLLLLRRTAAVMARVELADRARRVDPRRSDVVPRVHRRRLGSRALPIMSGTGSRYRPDGADVVLWGSIRRAAASRAEEGGLTLPASAIQSSPFLRPLQQGTVDTSVTF